MSTTFNLTNTATEVNTALQAVVGADTAPTDGSVNMVTSDGVFTYVGTQIGALAGKTITTESVGIAATNNDTSIPTSAAVKDYVDTSITADTSTPNNRLRIKILPTHFTGANRTQNGAQVSVPAGIYASTDIPAGYKATHFTHTTSSSSVSITVSEAQVGDSTLVQKGSGSGSGTKTINMTDVVGTDENYLVVTLFASGSGRTYSGGYFTIAAV